MEYYSPIKRNEVLTYATTWVKLENIMINERNQIQKELLIDFHLYEMSSIDKSQKQKVDYWLPRTWGEKAMAPHSSMLA